MDIVFVKDLRFKTIVGCWDWERQMEQLVSIVLEMGWDNKPAAESDDLKDALNYKEVSKRVENFVKDKKFELTYSKSSSKKDTGSTVALSGAGDGGSKKKKKKDKKKSKKFCLLFYMSAYTRVYVSNVSVTAK